MNYVSRITILCLITFYSVISSTQDQKKYLFENNALENKHIVLYSGITKNDYGSNYPKLIKKNKKQNYETFLNVTSFGLKGIVSSHDGKFLLAVVSNFIKNEDYIKKFAITEKLSWFEYIKHTVIGCDQYINGEKITKLPYESYESVVALALSHNNKLLAVGHSDGNVSLINLNTNDKTIKKYEGFNSIKDMEFSNDNKKLEVTCSCNNKTINITE